MSATDPLITLDQAAAMIPGRGGRPTARSTIYRWATRGDALRGGVRLTAYRVGRRLMTTVSDVHAFIAAPGSGAAPAPSHAPGTASSDAAAPQGTRRDQRTLADVADELDRRLATKATKRARRTRASGKVR